MPIRSSLCLWSAMALTVAISLPTFAATGKAPADTVHVLGKAPKTGCEVHAVTGGDRLEDQLARTPFALIRRGDGASSDLYADGFKRGDITVTIDGERHTTACPNRMDTRAGHVNLLDVEALTLDRTAGHLGSGLGGSMTFRRRVPGDEPRVQGVLRATAGHAEGHDLSVSAEANRVRATLRYQRWQPYTDADDRNFNRLYGYDIAPASAVYEGQIMRGWNEGNAVLTVESSDNLLFPYLKMDERQNQHYQASIGQQGHRFYVNYNDHVMDNALRTSARTMAMRTDATNTMLGVTGPWYEVFARNWDADNTITPLANPAMGISNHMLPDVWRVYASVHHELQPLAWLTLAGRLGVARTTIGDDTQLARYAELQAGAESHRWSVPFGLTTTVNANLGSDWRWSLATEIAADAPEIEALYIAVDKPGTSPTWLGNPVLDDPIRATARTELRHRHLSCELFASRVWNQPELRRLRVSDQWYQTYKSTDAVILGANLRATTTYADAGLVWNWAADTETWDPLAEIQPLTSLITLRSPAMGPTQTSLTWEHAITQDRVNSGLGERPTPAWDRVDLAVAAELGAWDLSLAVENLFNESYARHLSYQRNPFASGLTVLEPGRTAILTAAFQY